MVFFVWMSFLGFYVVYRRSKDIAVDFVVLRLGDGAMVATRLKNEQDQDEREKRVRR